MASGPKIPFSGILLILFGAVFLADQLGAVSFGHVFRTWWPMLLVISGLLQVVEHGGASFGGVVLLTLGVVFQLGKLGYMEVDKLFKLWPLLLIALGVQILMDRRGK